MLEQHAFVLIHRDNLCSVGGQLELPDGFLPTVYESVRAAGGLCIADDVQTALWRTGSHAFGFQRHGAVPDVLVLGKPLGNGFPLGAVVTTREVAASFARVARYVKRATRPWYRLFAVSSDAFRNA